MYHEFSLRNLAKARFNFDEDRPVMKKENHKQDGRVEAFNGEVAELNGPDESGFFGKEAVELHLARLTDYRQQEVADILLVGLSLADIFNFTLNEKYIEDMAAEYAELLGTTVVPNDTPLKPVEAFDTYQEAVYAGIIRRMNDQVTNVTVENMRHPKFAKDTLERILICCYLFFYLAGLSPIRAGYEKIARNMLRYWAGDYQPDDLRTYKKRVQDSKNRFDGPVDPKTGQRPQWGTIDFYGEYEREQVVYDWLNATLTKLEFEQLLEPA